MVHNPLPAGVTVRSTEPKAAKENNTLIWELGTLGPLQEKRLEMVLVPESRGDLSTARPLVTVTGSTTARILVREPKLTLKASGPERTLLGDKADVNLTISNPGDGAAEHIKIKVTLPGYIGERP